MSYQLVCRRCGAYHTEDRFRCPACGGILECRFDLTDHAYFCNIFRNARHFWDYRDLFPLNSGEGVSIGEGDTPVFAAKNLAAALKMDTVYIKNEGQNPTGTFKDRCQSVAYSKAVEMGANAVVIGSAGNAGAAAAAYSAAAGIPCFAFLPAFTPMERIAQTLRCGAHAIKIKGNVSDCIEMLEGICKERGWQNVSTAHACNPFQAEGCKTIAYELARDLNWQVPDWLLVPIGGGGILSGIWRGWCDLKEVGVIDRLPRIVGVQEDGCAAVVDAFDKHAAPDEIQRVKHPSGVAVAIQDAFPLDGCTALQAIYDSEGTAVAVSAEEIAEGQSLIGSTAGVFAEPASASTVAALKKLREQNVIGSGESAVCVITGNGLKDPAFAVAHAKEPAVSEMDEAQLSRIIDDYLKEDQAKA